MKTKISRILSAGITVILFLLFTSFVSPFTQAVLADTGGRILIPELPTGSSITIDGSDADWPSGEFPFSITAIGSGPSGNGRLFVKHPDNLEEDEELYLFVNIHDNTYNTGPFPDNLVLMFDTPHTEADTSDDRGIRFTRNGDFQLVSGTINSPVEDTTTTPSSEVSILPSSPGNPWQIEARILPSDLNLNSFNSLMGSAILASDFQEGDTTNGRWPNTATVDASTWANLLTRQPIDYVLLIDQSGSMGGDKWTSAKQAANNFALILSQMKDTDLDTEFANLDFPTSIPSGFKIGDRLGLTTFTWTGGDIDPTIDPALTLQLIPDPPGDYTGPLPTSPGGDTPIARGVDKGIKLFLGLGTSDSLPSDIRADINASPRTRVVMLLSDGKHNRPSSTINFTTEGDSEGFQYLPCGPTSPETVAGTKSLVRINTVALGTDSTVDTDKLNEIKNCFSGNISTTGVSSDTNIYNITPDTDILTTGELTQFFVETLLPYYGLNIINDTGANFSLAPGNRKLLLFAFWNNAMSAVPLEVTEPDSTIETGTADSSLGYSYLVIDNPQGGNYTNFTAAGADQRLVLVDLRTKAQFGIENKPYGTGSFITLKAKLRQDGKPITGANVTVNVEKPDEGVGDYATIHDPNDRQSCLQRLPALDLLKRWLQSPPPATTRATTASTAGDTLPRFERIDNLFKLCDKTELLRSQQPNLALHDDGRNGDALAGDGIYTLRFLNTQYGGSYKFSVMADKGDQFTRTKEQAEFVRVEVDPFITLSGFRILEQDEFPWTGEYYVLPSDRFGRYMGPGHANEVRFEFQEDGKAEWVSSVIDEGNGIYSRKVSYDPTQYNPVQGPEVTITVRGKVIQEKPFAVWIAILLLLIILGLFRLFFRRTSS